MKNYTYCKSRNLEVTNKNELDKVTCVWRKIIHTVNLEVTNKNELDKVTCMKIIHTVNLEVTKEPEGALMTRLPHHTRN